MCSLLLLLLLLLQWGLTIKLHCKSCLTKNGHFHAKPSECHHSSWDWLLQKRLIFVWTGLNQIRIDPKRGKKCKFLANTREKKISIGRRWQGTHHSQRKWERNPWFPHIHQSVHKPTCREEPMTFLFMSHIHYHYTAKKISLQNQTQCRPAVCCVLTSLKPFPSVRTGAIVSRPWNTARIEKNLRWFEEEEEEEEEGVVINACWQNLMTLVYLFFRDYSSQQQPPNHHHHICTHPGILMKLLLPSPPRNCKASRYPHFESLLGQDSIMQEEDQSWEKLTRLTVRV